MPATRPHPDDLPPALRRVLERAANGDWRRISADESGAFTVHNRPTMTRTVLPDVRPRPRRMQAQRASQRPSWGTVPGSEFTSSTSTARTGQTVPAPRSSRSATPARKDSGPSGRASPRTIEEVLAAVDATPGWSRRLMRNGHWRVEGPAGQRATVSATPSDYRTPLNDWSRLRRLGLEVAS